MGIGLDIHRIRLEALASPAIDRGDELDDDLDDEPLAPHPGENAADYFVRFVRHVGGFHRAEQSILRAVPDHEELEGWDFAGPTLPDALDRIARASGDSVLALLRTDANPQDRQAHLDRLPPEARTLSALPVVICLTPAEVRALAAARAATKVDAPLENLDSPPEEGWLDVIHIHDDLPPSGDAARPHPPVRPPARRRQPLPSLRNATPAELVISALLLLIVLAVIATKLLD